MSGHPCASQVYSNEGNRPLIDLVPADAKVVLDVGCGGGDNARVLRDRGCRVVGITVSNKESVVAGRWCERVLVADVEMDELDLEPGSFDAIVLSHVLEHMARPSEALARLAKYLRAGGIAAVAVPNMAFWRVRWRLAKGDWRREDAGWMDRTHLQFWSFRTAHEVFNGTPFSLEQRVGGSPAIPLWPARAIVPGLCQQVDSFFGSRCPQMFAMQVLLTARTPGPSPSPAAVAQREGGATA